MPPTGRPTATIGRHELRMFSGEAEFLACATAFLAEGLRRREQLMLVTDDPFAHPWPEDLIQRGHLQLASVSEVYGQGPVNPGHLRNTFAEAVDKAVVSGYSGIRVIADNTAAVVDADNVDSWMSWEWTADRFLTTNPVVGLCCFDTERLPSETLQQLAAAHPPAEC